MTASSTRTPWWNCRPRRPDVFLFGIAAAGAVGNQETRGRGAASSALRTNTNGKKFSFVMPAVMPALVARIHVFKASEIKDVDGRNKSGHDAMSESRSKTVAIRWLDIGYFIASEDTATLTLPAMSAITRSVLSS